MKLSDQEQVILKAIGHGVAQVSQVIKAVGYPKATTKKILVRMSEKGIVSLHRHDYPQSLTPAQRKVMVKIGSNYYGAVSVREKNPKGKHLAGATAKQERQYEHILESAKKYHRYGKRKKEVAARTVRARAKNKSGAGKGKTALKTTGRALKSAAHGLLGAGSQILGAGARALNPVRRKIRNKYIDLIIKGQAKKTPQGWKVGKKTFAQGRGTVNVSSGYYLDRHTGMVYAKRERNMARKRKRNISEGFYDASGIFHPIRSASDYSPTTAGETGRGRAKKTTSRKKKAAKRKASSTARHRAGVKTKRATKRSLAGRSLRRTTSTGKRLKQRNISEGFYDASGIFHPIRSATDYSPAAAGETGRKAKRTRSRKKLASKRKASATARHRSVVKTRKGTTRRLAGRAIKKSSGLLKKRGRKNPSAESIRKKFSGRVSGERDVFVPASTPKGKLAKLGNLVLIQTEQGTIKPVHGSAVLLADTKGKLHVGSLSGANLFDGPRKSFGQVKRVEYEDSKPHLGFPNPIIWHHRLGEETGHRPTLHADGKGGLVFRGGRYRLTTRGIEN